MIQEHISFYAEKRIIHVQVADIMFVECSQSNMRIFCTNHVWDLRMSLDHLQSKLPPGRFVRIHRSYLVAIEHISLYRKGIVHLGDIELPVHTLSACPFGYRVERPR
ncbi:LytR/AlgR family response regulator transcription factor [Flavihumibacter fluvii]|uniref:LytR/AlgR family response regulator transcription factor n=1 Tax=Flavihumibacter fluvii TaxID=2838157 RepID=UPI001BDF363E|nr:LytTR family DNA-binding domain-containing protein [Flavihumibacter fluvii]ULQ50964.1 LytTR family transcriptional regulator [Flavihumibacter fluvii]